MVHVRKKGRAVAKQQVMDPVLAVAAAITAFLMTVAIALLLLAAPAGAATEIGSTFLVLRNVQGTLATQVRALSPDDIVYQNEVVETAAKSASKIRFRDDTNISVGPNSRVVLDKFVYDPVQGTGALTMNVAEGVFRFVSGNMPSESYSIRTPTLTIGVRGTVFDGLTLPDGTTLVVLRSDDGLTVTTPTGNTAVLNRRGMSIIAFPDGSLTRPAPPPSWAQWRFETMHSLLASFAPWSPGGAGGPTGPNDAGNGDPQGYDHPTEGIGKRGEICIRC